MTTELIIILIFCYVDGVMMDIQKHPQAKLYPSELVTIGILRALKGGGSRAFHRWLKRDYDALFGGLPERTRLERALKAYEAWCDRFLAEPGLLLVMDSYPIELLFPIREGRSDQQVGTKGRDKGRWTIGLRLCWQLDTSGRVVDWAWAPLNVPDKTFNGLAACLSEQSLVFTDLGFRDANGVPDNLVLCPKGTYNDRMMVETAFSLLTVVCHLNKIGQRVEAYIEARLAYVAAMFNTLLALFHQLHPKESPFKMSIAQFSL
jgi:hypothetical protein